MSLVRCGELYKAHTPRRFLSLAFACANPEVGKAWERTEDVPKLPFRGILGETPDKQRRRSPVWEASRRGPEWGCGGTKTVWERGTGPIAVPSTFKVPITVPVRETANRHPITVAVTIAVKITVPIAVPIPITSVIKVTARVPVPIPTTVSAWRWRTAVPRATWRRRTEGGPRPAARGQVAKPRAEHAHGRGWRSPAASHSLGKLHADATAGTRVHEAAQFVSGGRSGSNTIKVDETNA